MGKSIRNTDPQTVSSKDDVMALLGGDGQQDTGGPGKPATKKEAPAAPKGAATTKDEVMDLLSGTVKKKDGAAEPSATPSPSPSASPDQALNAFNSKTLTPADVTTLGQTDQGRKMGLSTLTDQEKDVFATAHNGLKKADLSQSVNKIIDDFYPATKDPKQNNIRSQIKQGVLSGNQEAITNLKTNLINGLQDKINSRFTEVADNFSAKGPGAFRFAKEEADSDPEVQHLRSQQDQVRQTIDEYGKMSLVNSKDMEPWLKLDAQHPDLITNEGAYHLGKLVKDRYGIDKSSPNKDYDITKAGLDLIIKSLKMDVNEYLSYGIPTHNKELLARAGSKLDTLKHYQGMYNRLDTELYPDVGLDRTERFLGDIIAEKHPYKLIRTKEDVQEAADIANERNPGFKEKYGTLARSVAEMQDSKTVIPRGGAWYNELIGGVQKGAMSQANDLLKFAPEDQLTESDKAILRTQGAAVLREPGKKTTTEPSRLVFDKEGKVYRELPNENYSTLPWNNTFRFIGESVPGLAEFIATEGLSAETGAALSLGKMGKEAKSLSGLIGATYITSYNNNREFADANIDDKSSLGEAKKIVAANFITLANAGVFHILNASPSKIVEAAISKSVMPEVIEMFEKNSWEKLSAKETEGFIKDNILPRAKAMVAKFTETAGSGVKMGTAGVIDQKVKDFVGIISNSKYTPSTAADNAREFASQALLITSIGLPGMISTGIMPHSSQEALHQAGLYGPQYIDAINDKVEDGSLDPHKAAGMISMIKTMGEELAKAKVELNDDGLPLTTRQQRDLAIANFKKRGAAAMEENKMAVPAGAEGEADKQIKEIKKENNWQPIEETPTFKSVTEVEESGKKGEKVKAMADIDPAKQYNYQKEGVETTESGADLIHHLQTGDIYEHEEASGDEAKVAEAEKGENAEGKDKESAKDQEQAPVDAKAVVADAIEDGKIADNLAPHAEADPEGFLKGIADQALGYTRNEGERVKSPYGGAEDAAREQFGDKVVDAALKLHPEDGSQDGKKVSRSTFSEEGQKETEKQSDTSAQEKTLNEEYGKAMQQVRPGAGPGEKAKILSDLPRRLYERMAEDPSVKSSPEIQRQLKELRGRISEEGQYTEEALRNLSGAELADAPRKLLEAFRSSLAMPEVSPDVSPGRDNAAKAEALQGSYDRLLASGADPDESEMRALKSRIDALSAEPESPNSSPIKTETDGNVQKEQGVRSPEGGEADGQKNDEKGNEKDGQKEVKPEGDTGTEPKEGSAPVPEDNSPIVGIRDSIVNSERVHKGLKPLVKEFVRSWGSNWAALKNNISKGFSPRQFMEEAAIRIAKGERVVFTDYDYATMLFDRLDIQNNIARATDELKEAIDKGKEGDDTQPNVSSLGQRAAAQELLNHYNRQLDQSDIVARAIKSETGRALSAIQMITKMNGELADWSNSIASSYNGHVPEVIRDFVARIQKEYKEKSEQLSQHYEEQLKKYADEAFKKAKKEATPADKGVKAKKSVKVAGKELADKIRALRPKNDGTASANLFGLPIAVYDTALVAIANAVEAGASIIDAINEAIKNVDFDSDKDKAAFISHLQNEEDPGRPAAQQASAIKDIESLAKENNTNNLSPEMVQPLRDLMKSYVKDGSVNSLEELVAKTHDAIKGVLSDVEERDIRDAFSGYGMRPDTEAGLKSQLTKFKEQARSVSEYQDSLERPANETKSQEQKRLTKAGKLYDKVQKYMREMGIDAPPPPTTEEGRKALALDQAKKRTQSIINDLNKQILAGERKQRNGVEADHELDVLRAERKRLSDQLRDIDNSNISPEERIRRVEDTLNRQISNYERQIREGVDPLRRKEDRPTTKQIEELRKRKNDLKKEVNAMRNDMNPSLSPEEKALAKYNESLARQVGNLEQKIADKDYGPPENAPVEFKRDPVSLALESRLKKLQSDFYATKRAGEAINQKWFRKAMSLASSAKRAFVLSGISTFARLGAAVGWNTIFEPAGEAIAGTIHYGVSKTGFGKKINQIAERYGIPDLKTLGTVWGAEGSALKAVTKLQTWKDFVSDAKNGYSELSLMYGHANEHVPKEARDTWMNIEHGLEAFGRAHGAVKGVSKRMEFTRSYIIRKEALKRKGENVDNPVIQQSIGAMAYQDAMRSILMEDNKLSKFYQDAVHALQKGGLGANILALTLQEMMPIVKIPTNLVLNAGRATLGTPLAGGYIAVRGLIDVMSGGKSEYGINKLTPEESDAVLRNLRKGNVGMALMLGGLFAPNMFGASHYYLKGTQQPDGMDEGDVKFFGLTVPKWLADNPYLVSMKIGASLRNAFDYYTDDQGVDVAHAAVRSFAKTAFSTLKETPIAGTPVEAANAIEGYGGDWFWYSQVKSTLEPRILQEAAEWTDNRDEWYDIIGGDRIKRKPSSVGDALKTGIPGLREEVDEK